MLISNSSKDVASRMKHPGRLNSAPFAGDSYSRKLWLGDQLAYRLGKQAADAPGISYALAGRLYASKSGWILLSVPNAMVHGMFDALQETGLELPPGPEGRLNAHISVMRKEEVDSLGGVDRITERGHVFRYTLGPMREVVPDGWDDIGKVWLVEVRSPELEKLRKSYGLTALPNNNRFRFHITVAVRRKKVLQENDVTKT
jgi:hypothetical protein